MRVYADSSLLISYYITDSHSTDAQALIRGSNDPLPFTGLHHLEMRNALALGLFRRILTPGQVAAAWSDVERDLRSGRLTPHRVKWEPIYRAAAQWAAIHAPTIGCRSLDVLHVALAKKLKFKQFFTFDARQRSLGLMLGLAVKP